MLGLYIDSSFKPAQVALFDNEKNLLIVKEDIITTQRAEQILPIIDQLLKDNEYNLKDIRILAARRGIGSYTGLRVGLSIISALAWTLHLPVIPITSQESRILSETELRAEFLKITPQEPLTEWQTIEPLYQIWTPNNGSAIMNKNNKNNENYPENTTDN